MRKIDAKDADIKESIANHEVVKSVRSAIIGDAGCKESGARTNPTTLDLDWNSHPT